MKTTPKYLLCACMLISSSAVMAADVCMSASALHQQKMAKYQVPTLPSILEDCGINDMLSGFAGDIFGSIGIGDISLFCGYTARDIGGWYGIEGPNSIGIGAEYGYGDVDVHNLLGESDALFDYNVNGGVRTDGNSNGIDWDLGQ
ncbi:hypothetical protein AAFX24_27920 [Vibrio mediterranei]|uniref:hypothetical protein n=1 Tax=Vibrio mediterranei TaxID=689 RepID=UPI0038CE2BE5